MPEAYPPFGTSRIRCGRRRCSWTGLETQLKKVPHPRNRPGGIPMTLSVCPKCRCDSYYFVPEKGACS